MLPAGPTGLLSAPMQVHYLSREQMRAAIEDAWAVEETPSPNVLIDLSPGYPGFCLVSESSVHHNFSAKKGDVHQFR